MTDTPNTPSENLQLLWDALDTIQKLRLSDHHTLVESALSTLAAKDAEIEALRGEKLDLERCIGNWERDVGKLQDNLAAAVAERDEERKAHQDTISRRDFAEDWADKLAYAIESEEVLGEHSNANNPWGNALALIEDWNHKADEERERADELAARVGALEDHVRWLLPLAKGYAYKHSVPSNMRIVCGAEEALAVADPAASLAAHDAKVLEAAWERVDRCCTAQATRASYEHIRKYLRAAILSPAPEADNQLEKL